jgi:putative SOS response-associated peptidase YedK
MGSTHRIRTCTIITGEPNELVAQIHSRMPVILPEQLHAAWLGETDDGNLKELLLPYPADQTRMWEISPRVNSKRSTNSTWKLGPVSKVGVVKTYSVHALNFGLISLGVMFLRCTTR